MRFFDPKEKKLEIFRGNYPDLEVVDPTQAKNF